MKKANKPLPCPKCGKEIKADKLAGGYEKGYWIGCSYCMYFGELYMPTRRQAVAAWNAGVAK